MSIVITCNLSDGVIVGTDSAVTIQGQAIGPNGKVTSGVLKVYNSSEKLFQLEELPIAIASYGLGLLGERSIGSYIKEFEFKINESKQGQKKFEKKTVKEVAEQLRDFFMEKYKNVLSPLLEKELGTKYNDIPENKKPILGLVVSGFSPNEYLSETWQITIPLENKEKGFINVRKPGQFGTNWFGQIESLTRLIKGFSPPTANRIIDYLVKKYKIGFNEQDKQELSTILSNSEYKIPYQAMPLQEGIDHVKYLLDVVVGQTRFVVGAPVCGGPLKIGVVKRGEKNFHILTDNELKVT